MSRPADLTRIRDGLVAAAAVLEPFTPGAISAQRKAGGDPVTEADVAIDTVLRRLLPQAGEGWLSEETTDDPSRLTKRRLWVVDPLDGTREFIEGIPEWCVSVGLVEDGRAVAGGVLIPSTGRMVLGSVEDGVTLDGAPCRVRSLDDLSGVEVLASRSEVRRGEWESSGETPYRVKPMGSVALKLALVAAGLADATWTRVPKHEWDVAAGAALVTAAGGEVWTPEGTPPRFNQPVPKFTGLFAVPQGIASAVRACFPCNVP